MPAVSKSQQRLFAIVKAIQAGKAKADPSKGPAADVAKSAKKKDVDDFASTKTKGLPNKVKKEESIVREIIREELKAMLSEESAPIWWTNMSPTKQKSYLRKHPNSDFNLRVGAKKEDSEKVKLQSRLDKLNQEKDKNNKTITKLSSTKPDTMSADGRRIAKLDARNSDIWRISKKLQAKL